MDAERFYAGLRDCWSSGADLYERLNNVRNWVNAHFPTFELYLEDVWNDHVPGETHFEYILRSRKTLDETPALGYDIYKNHQDTNGVWHLDDYTNSVLAHDSEQALFEALWEFIQANPG
jgi:hypothetical protein